MTSLPPLSKSVTSIDRKVAEAEYLLQLIAHPKKKIGFVEINALVNAFISGVRNITWAMQYALRDEKGFDDWYAAQQEKMKRDTLCRFFHDYRTATIHKGQSFICGGSYHNGAMDWYFMIDGKMVRAEVYKSCRAYFVKVLGIVFECYTNFKYVMSEKWYYSKENFECMGKTINEADAEVIGLSTAVTGASAEEPERWRLLQRNLIGCEIQHLFREYLRKEFKEPV